MADRVLKVNAFTTFDLLEGRVEGHGFAEAAFATLNVRTAREDPADVTLELELDNVALDSVPAHADRVTLSAAEARELASELEQAAERIEASQVDEP
ncbi:hypothetical protein HLRTI_000315 [Halorhabdus tiamatea SARL4B]|uniref:Uncharacterized protein n=1 Tax=Halorhabdus tiamatea SARL4B TaxID=1033806 RepID=F7PK34_9EURY|nr:DUF6360 family protein [Halorhabdus tiamatea]ERJ07567.1 hypothetical protein HLRTI_000315 [Halorhabdus tiamatea SARL4B]CCQ33483.1 conserved hypothetical protein [Halorhabdus tiamatea SARL4B]